MILKLAVIERKGGNLIEDDERLGERFQVFNLAIGSQGILHYLDNDNKALFTSTVEHIGIFAGSSDGTIMTVATRNTTYEFVVEDELQY